MALIKCPECKKKISEQSEKCVHCGYPIAELINQNIDEVTKSDETEIMEEEIVKEKKPINKKMLLGIIIGAVLVAICGAIIAYNAMLPKIKATKKFNKAVASVKELNKELEKEIKKSEDFIMNKPSLLDEELLSELENAISDAKAVKETNFKVPSSVEKIEARIKELNAVDYSVVLDNLEQKYNLLDVNAKRYQLVNQPTEAYVIQCLQTVPEIVNISAVTEDNDPNGNLNKLGGYSAAVYFADSRINLDKNISGETLIEQGTDAGGCIEVYTCVEDAIKRRDYLAGFDGGIFASGTHTVIGTVLVRVSDELTATQQKEIEAKVIAALTYLPEYDVKDEQQNEIEEVTTNQSTEQKETTSTNEEKETSSKPTQSTQQSVSRKEQAVNIAISNVNESLTPNDIKKILSNNGFSTDEIDYAVYGGYINWQENISCFVYGLNSDANEIVITKCNKCDRRFYGHQQVCPYMTCGSGSLVWSYYHGYSRSETISKLLNVGFSQSDVDNAMKNFAYGEFIDEKDFSDCIDVSDITCEHSWTQATCQTLSQCTYCGETKGEYAEHEYSQCVCIYCGAEEP